MSTSRENDPSKWANAIKASEDVYYSYDRSKLDIASVLVWHWCTEHNRWQAAGVQNHTPHSTEPLHLEPSLKFECCGKHGFIRGGQWSDT